MEDIIKNLDNLFSVNSFSIFHSCGQTKKGAERNTRPGVDKVKPKVWFKSSYEIDHRTAVGIRTWDSSSDWNSLWKLPSKV